MSTFLHWFVIVITLGSLAGCYWLVKWANKSQAGEAREGDVTGHTWDDNLQEYNNPLPMWWLWLFYITIIFAVIYFALYPGLGNFKGYLSWTSQVEYQDEMAAADATYGPVFAKFASTDIKSLASDSKAMQAGQRLFLTYCATCHGSDAGGARGFPDLTDKDWLWGGSPEEIKTSIMQGRMGVMPKGADFGLTEADIDNVTNYVMSLSGRKVDGVKAKAGKATFDTICATCHTPDGTGNKLMGAPNLTDNTWLYGASAGVIKQTITNGRNGQMPAHGEFLGNDKVHLLSAYVYSLSAR